MKEKDVENYLVKSVKELGGVAYKFVSPGNAGVPDRICVMPEGLVYFVEVKKPGGCLSQKQYNQIVRMKKLAHRVEIVHDYEAVDELKHRMAHDLTNIRIKEVLLKEEDDCNEI